MQGRNEHRPVKVVIGDDIWQSHTKVVIVDNVQDGMAIPSSHLETKCLFLAGLSRVWPVTLAKSVAQ